MTVGAAAGQQARRHCEPSDISDTSDIASSDAESSSLACGPSPLVSHQSRQNSRHHLTSSWLKLLGRNAWNWSASAEALICSLLTDVHTTKGSRLKDLSARTP